MFGTIQHRSVTKTWRFGSGLLRVHDVVLHSGQLQLPEMGSGRIALVKGPNRRRAARSQVLPEGVESVAGLGGLKPRC
jgi:hypothetical protein